MVFKHHVKAVSETFIRTTLAPIPSAVSALLHPSIFEKFVEMLTVRCNELDALGWIPSRWALDRFIEDAARAFARVQLEKIGQHSELMAAQQQAQMPGA